MANHGLLPEYTSISGAWVLDLSRSDTFESYLRLLGAPDGSIRAQVAGEQTYQSRNVIALDDSTLVIHKDTTVNHCTETFMLDQEQVAPSRSGLGAVNRTTVSLRDGERLDGYTVVAIKNDSSGQQTLQTVEARRLVERGLAHNQHIHVRDLVTGGQCTVMRTWVRVPMTQDDQIRLLC